MLMRFDPFRELDRFTQQLAGPRQWMPMDAYRKDDHVYVHFDLPGVDPESIELTVERNSLQRLGRAQLVLRRHRRRTGQRTPAGQGLPPTVAR